MQEQRTPVPGLCQCGCGQPTKPAPRTITELGWAKGKPRPYLKGHAQRISGPGPNPSGLCLCGCGGRTPIARQSYRWNGDVRGTPVRYCVGHNSNRYGHLPVYVVDTAGCWVWQRSVSSQGYGRIGTDYAHRVYYERAKGPIPEGMELDHLCRVRACVNPDHLEPVTSAENTRRGAATKLTPEDVEDIRAATGTQAEIAARYGINSSHVCRIRAGSMWRESAAS